MISSASSAANNIGLDGFQQARPDKRQERVQTIEQLSDAIQQAREAVIGQPTDSEDAQAQAAMDELTRRKLDTALIAYHLWDAVRKPTPSHMLDAAGEVIYQAPEAVMEDLNRRRRIITSGDISQLPYALM